MISAWFSIETPLASDEEFGLVGLTDLYLHDDTTLFATGRGGDWLSVYDIGETALETSLSQQWFIPETYRQLIDVDLALREGPYQDQLYLTGLNSDALVGLTMNADTGVRPVGTQTLGFDFGTLTEIELVAGTQTGIGALAGGGLVNLNWDMEDSPSILDAVQDSPLVGQRASDIALGTLNGQTYAVVSYGLDDTVSLLQQDTTGNFRHISDTGAKEGAWFDTPDDIVMVTVSDGQLYAVVAGLGSLTTFAVTDKGLQPVDHLLDDLNTRFDGASHLKHIKVSEHDFVLAGGSDGGISLLSLLPGGRLQHIQYVEGTGDVPLSNISAIEAIATPDGIRLWVATQSQPYLAELSVDLPNLGINRNGNDAGGTLNGTALDDILIGADGADHLTAGAGNDILMDGAGQDHLQGGEGADLFIFAPDDAKDVITDFQPGQDQIDLSAYGTAGGIGGMIITSRGWGAELRIEDEALEVRTDNGQMLSAQDFTTDNLITSGRATVNLTEYPAPEPDPPEEIGRGFVGMQSGVTPADLKPEWINSAGGGRIETTSRSDQVWAGDAADRIFGGNGSDWISGGDNPGASFDMLFGESGNDTLFGNAGFDLLSGGSGNDVLDGGAQSDELFGDGGSDILLGDLGKDRLFGGNGQDQLYGGDGNDSLSGQAGSDTLWGGNGRDSLEGGTGDDILDGGTSADVLHAGSGQDTLIGGGGNDILSGGMDADEFVFNDWHGHDIIEDFDAFDEDEFLNFLSLDSIDSIQDILGKSRQVGEDVVIDTSEVSSVTLQNVRLSDLDESDFAF
jgi:Ca2+-binding RTX toxin-like protein